MSHADECFVPLLVICIGGLAGVAVDMFAVFHKLGLAGRWVYQLDVLAALLLSLAICGVGAYRLRRG